MSDIIHSRKIFQASHIDVASAEISEDTSPVSYGVVATTIALPACTYLSNVITASLNGVLVNIDDVTMEVGSLILVKDQVAQLQNGIYEVTSLGSVGTPWVLTRLDSYNETSEVYPSQVNVLSGVVNIAKYFLQTTPEPSVGIDPLVFVEKAAPTISSSISTLTFADVHTIAILPNSPTYTNGSVAGMPAQNATYTATTNGAFPTLQGIASFVGMVVLVKDQIDAKKNGDYVLLNKGTGGSKWQLRRVSYSSALLFPRLWEIQQGTSKGAFYQQDTKTLVNATIGSTGNIVFTNIGQPYFTDAGTYTYLTSTIDLFQVGTSTSMNASLGVKGQDNTSATINTLIQNSAGVPLLYIDNNGGFTIGLNASLSGSFGMALGEQARVVGQGISMGHNAGRFQTTGATKNMLFGVGSGATWTITGFQNVGFGESTLSTLTTGSYNTAVGYQALYGFGQFLTGVYNTAVGMDCGVRMGSGSYNTLMGNGVAGYLATGSYNVMLGSIAGSNPSATAGSRNIYLGYAAGNMETTTSDRLFISNIQYASEALGRSGSLIYGIMDATAANQRFTINAKVGISGPATSTSPLNVTGLPTSAVGLVTGDVWNNLGILTIV